MAKKVPKKISKYFILDEFTRSRTAEARKLKNVPNKQQLEVITFVAKSVADPLREASGGPLIIRSGFRSPAVNKSVGGVATSYHQYDNGQWAFDCVSTVLSLNELMEKLISLNLPITKAILELDEGVLHIQGEVPQYLARDIISGKKIYVPWSDYKKSGKVIA